MPLSGRSELKNTITLFMWGYQLHYRFEIQHRARTVLELIAPNLRVDALLIGVRTPEATDGHPVCVEPEDGDWDPSLFFCKQSRCALLLTPVNLLDSCRLMFVLGAGASVPLGMPTTKSLLEKLENKTRLGKLAAEIQSAAYRFRIGVDDVNIEDFFEYLYELQLMIWFAQRSELPTLLPGFTARATVTEHRAQGPLGHSAKCRPTAAPNVRRLLWREG